MPTKNPRVNVVMDTMMYGTLRRMADKEGISLSLFTRGLIKESLEVYEDSHLQVQADERMKNFDHKKAVSHKDAWK